MIKDLSNCYICNLLLHESFSIECVAYASKCFCLVDIQTTCWLSVKFEIESFVVFLCLVVVLILFLFFLIDQLIK